MRTPLFLLDGMSNDIYAVLRRSDGLTVYTDPEVAGQVLALLNKGRQLPDLKVCPNCSTQFQATTKQARYCSNRCKNTYRTRKYRQKKRAACNLSAPVGENPDADRG